jgi:hypothetical protein
MNCYGTSSSALVKMMEGMKERNPQHQLTYKYIPKPAQDVLTIAFKAIINLAPFHNMVS